MIRRRAFRRRPRISLTKTTRNSLLVKRRPSRRLAWIGGFAPGAARLRPLGRSAVHGLPELSRERVALADASERLAFDGLRALINHRICP